MPTGYTGDIQDGKITTLRDFALRCARGMGALITMRDDSWNAPIPEKLEPNTKYYDDQLAKAKKALEEIPKLSADDCERRAAAEFDEAMASHLKYANNRSQSRLRYQDMLCQVEQWKVPPELASLKEFMISQLKDSINFDCSESYRPEPPKRLTGERWRELALEHASRDIAYHTEEREKEIQRIQGRNEWLKAFWRALPAA